MAKVFKLRKGLNIPLKGKPENIWLNSSVSIPQKIGICPDDFIGLIPKPMVEENNIVKIGSPLFYHKNFPEIIVTSPISGNLVSIKRGLKRKIETFIIESDYKNLYDENNKIDISKLSGDEIRTALLKTGLWVYIRQRPFNYIANPNIKPKAIFISAFDTAPLAPDIEIILQDKLEPLQEGINILKKLANVPIYVGLKKDKSSIFEKIENINVNYFDGPHPAGNVGIQIHHIDPINKGEVVWTLQPEDLIILGKYSLTAQYDASRIITLVGSQVLKPGYVNTIQGAEISSFTKNNVIGENNRFISGNVLTGRKISEDGFLGFYDRMVTIIPEGNEYEFLGWAMPGLNKFSMSRTFLSSICPKKEFQINSNYNGGERAFVMTGEYEKVLPMDILPQQLIKAAMIKDIDLMEKLGIYEVVEEDLALCEFVCTSKIEVQTILREALDYIYKETF